MNAAVNMPAQHPGFDLHGDLIRRENPVQAFGFTILLAYLFAANSRVLDVAAPWLHLPMFMAAVMYVAALALGGAQRMLSTKAGYLYVALTGWMGVSILLTVWKGNALQTLTEQWLKSASLYLAIVGLVYTTQQVRRASNMIAVALTITCIIALTRGDVLVDGRLVIRNSKFGDPNDMALFCIMALMSCLSLWSRSKSNLVKLPLLGSMAAILLVLLKTGSRGGVLGLAIVLLYVFIRSTMTQRMMMMVAVLMGGAVMVVVAGKTVTDRLTTFLNDDAADTKAEQGAVGSTQNRMYLLQRSLELTATHPLWGVGLGNFMYAENVLANEAGQRHGSWHQTHNMYTQVSSELGLVGLALYIGIMVMTWKSLNRAEYLARSHPERIDIEKTAFWLKAIFIAFASAGTFLSVAYQDVLPMMAGLAVTFERAVVAENHIWWRKRASMQQPGGPQQLPSSTPAVPARNGVGARRPALAINRSASPAPGLGSL